MKVPELKAVLFDMGSTLIEFENSTWDVLRLVCAEKGHEFLKGKKVSVPDFEEFSALLDGEFLKARNEVENNLNEFKAETVACNFFRVLNLSTSDGLCEIFLEKYYDPISYQLTVIDGAEDVLTYFKERSLILYIEKFYLQEFILVENYLL